MSRIHFICMILFLGAAFTLMGCTAGREKAEARKRALDQRDYAILAQQSINFSGFQPFLHTELPGRRSLCVKGGLLSDSLKLAVPNMEVRVVSGTDSCPNIVLFEEMTIRADTAVVQFRYPIEGFFCTLTFVSDAANWKLIDSVYGEN
jgi:hypothetical protein